MGIGPIRIGRPSPAMLVAIVALFGALGGTAYAALGAKDKKRVKRIADAEIAKAAPGLSVKHATSADQLGGTPAGQFQTRLWAVVRSDGTLARGAGVVSSSGNTNYEVRFNRDITNCAFARTIGHPADGAESFGQIEAHIESLDNARDTVGVFTANSAGILAPRSFHLIVAC